MVFPKNILRITHNNGATLEFNPLEALKRIQIGANNLKVACSDEWKGSRPEQANLEEVKPFDWSFFTDYQGTTNDKIKVVDTDVKLDIFKLMKKERILFYTVLTLFEDELHDHGIASCSVKLVSNKLLFFFFF